ncbi:GMC oxidoreductase, partial [Rhizoctonia solani]
MVDPSSPGLPRRSPGHPILESRLVSFLLNYALVRRRNAIWHYRPWRKLGDVGVWVNANLNLDSLRHLALPSRRDHPCTSISTRYPPVSQQQQTLARLWFVNSWILPSRRVGALVQLNTGKATRSGAWTVPLLCVAAVRLQDITCILPRFPPLGLTTDTSFKVCDALALLKLAATCRRHGKGVSHHSKSKPLTAEAGKEVLLLAVLELSGTGNSNVLQKHKITPNADLLGVWENCQDRVSASTTYEVKKGQPPNGKARDRPLTASHSMLSHIDLYFLASSAKIVHMHRWLWEDVRKEIHMVLPKEQYRIEELLLRKKMSNVEMLPHPGKYTIRDFPKSRADRVHSFSRRQIVSHDCYLPTVPQSACLGHAQHPKTSDSVSPPAMDANYLSKQADRSILAELVKFADKLAKAEPLATILVARQGPSPDTESDKVITKRAKGNNRTLHHPIGTAVMTSESLGGMNAGVIPMHLAVQLHHTVYGIAERATDVIKSGSGL